MALDPKKLDELVNAADAMCARFDSITAKRKDAKYVLPSFVQAAQWGQQYAVEGRSEDYIREWIKKGGYGPTTLSRVLKAYREQLGRGDSTKDLGPKDPKEIERLLNKRGKADADPNLAELKRRFTSAKKAYQKAAQKGQTAVAEQFMKEAMRLQSLIGNYKRKDADKRGKADSALPPTKGPITGTTRKRLEQREMLGDWEVLKWPSAQSNRVTIKDHTDGGKEKTFPVV